MKIEIEKLGTYGNKFLCPLAVIVRDNYILVGLRNYTPDKWKSISVWTIPGGRCDPGEKIIETLRREVQEEVGISNLSIHEFIGEVAGAKEGDRVPIFFCTTDQEARLMEPEKFSKWSWIPIREYVSGHPWSEMNPEAHRIISEKLKTL